MSEQKMKRLTERIVYLPHSRDTDRPVLAAVSGTDRTFYMDAGNSPAHAGLFLQELERFGVAEADLMMLTHWHWDHIFGLKRFGLPVLAHTDTRRAMEAMLGREWTDEALDESVRSGVESEACADHIKKEFGSARDIEIVLPAIVFGEKVELDLGGVTCLIEHVGGDHAADSCVLYIKEEKTLFLGDCLGPAIYAPERYFTRDALLPLLDKLESYDADIVVASHDEPWTRERMHTELGEYRSLMEITHACGGRKEEMLPVIAEKWGREPAPGDDAFIDWFINGFFLSHPAPSAEK